MARRPVFSGDERKQALTENLVIVRTTELAARPKFHELETANGTRRFGKPAGQFADVRDDQGLDDRVEAERRRSRREGETGLAGADEAEVEFPSPTVDLFRQVDGRFVGTALAGHCASHPRKRRAAIVPVLVRET